MRARSRPSERQRWVGSGRRPRARNRTFVRAAESRPREGRRGVDCGPLKRQGAGPEGPLRYTAASNAVIGLDQANAVFCRRRRSTAPTLPKPKIIISQVAGSGTETVGTKAKA